MVGCVIVRLSQSLETPSQNHDESLIFFCNRRVSGCFGPKILRGATIQCCATEATLQPQDDLPGMGRFMGSWWDGWEKHGETESTTWQFWALDRM